MNYPSKAEMFGHKIAVEVSTEPFGVMTPEGRTLRADTLGYFDVQNGVIRVFHTERCPELGQSTLIHELIEAANQYGDLKLDHTQISTLSSSLFQAFNSMGVTYAVAS